MGCFQSKPGEDAAVRAAQSNSIPVAPPAEQSISAAPAAEMPAPVGGELILTERLGGAKFQLIARLLIKLFSVPVAAVTTVEGQTFCLRAAEGLAANKLRASLARWQQVIDHPGVFIIEDALNDARLAAADPGGGYPAFRFYAGVALCGPSGQRYGTLSVLDEVPRTFPAEASKILGNCAAMLVNELQREVLAASRGQLAGAGEEGAALGAGPFEELCQRCDASGDALVVLCMCRRVTEVERWDILHANATWHQATGLTSEQAIGQNFWSLFQPENPDIKEHPVLLHDATIGLRRPFNITVRGKMQSRTLAASLWPAEIEGHERSEATSALSAGTIYFGLVSKPEITLTSARAATEQASQPAAASACVEGVQGGKAAWAEGRVGQHESPPGSPKIAAQRKRGAAEQGAAASWVGPAGGSGARSGKQQGQLQMACSCEQSPMGAA